MIPKTDLFTLIKSLTKNEKAYFKMYARSLMTRKDGRYLEIFDAIVAQDVYDEYSIRQQFKGAKFLDHLHVKKNYIYKLLLKSLRSFHGNFSVEAEINTLFNEGLILYNKGLYDLALNTFQYAKKKALNYEYFLKCVDINLRITNILRRYKSGTKGFYETDLYQENIVFTNNAQEINRTLLFKRKMYVLQRKAMASTNSTMFVTEAKKIISDDFFKSASKSKLYRVKDDETEIYASYYRILNRPDKVLEFRAKKVELLELLNLRDVFFPNTYITALYNLCNVLLELKKHTELLSNLEKIESLKYDSRYSSPYFQITIFEFVISTKLKVYFELNDIKGVEQTLKFEDEYFKKIETKITPVSYSFICFNAASVLFNFKKYKDSLKWINKKILTEKNELTYDVYQQIEILKMMIYVELKHYDLLESVAKSFVRKLILNKHNEHDNYIVIIKLFVKLIINNIYENPLFESFTIELEKILLNEKRKQHRAFLNFLLSWSQAKVD